MLRILVLIALFFNFAFCHAQQRWYFLNETNLTNNLPVRVYFYDIESAKSLPINQVWIKELLLAPSKWESICPDGHISLETALSCMSIANSEQGDVCRLSLWEVNCSISMLRSLITVDKETAPIKTSPASEWYPSVPGSISETINTLICSKDQPWRKRGTSPLK